MRNETILSNFWVHPFVIFQSCDNISVYLWLFQKHDFVMEAPRTLEWISPHTIDLSGRYLRTLRYHCRPKTWKLGEGASSLVINQAHWSEPPWQMSDACAQDGPAAHMRRNLFRSLSPHTNTLGRRAKEIISEHSWLLKLSSVIPPPPPFAC